VVVLVVMIMFQKEHALGAMHRHYVPTPEVKKVLFGCFLMRVKNLPLKALIYHHSWLPHRHLLYKVQYPCVLLQPLSSLIPKFTKSVLCSHWVYDMFLYHSNVPGRLLVWLKAFAELGSRQ
jgi:hypothetical protein